MTLLFTVALSLVSILSSLVFAQKSALQIRVDEIKDRGDEPDRRLINAEQYKKPKSLTLVIHSDIPELKFRSNMMEHVPQEQPNDTSYVLQLDEKRTTQWITIKAGYPFEDKPFEANFGKKKILCFRVTSIDIPKGSLIITSKPAGAKIIFNEQDTHKTAPDTFLTAKDCTLLLKKESYIDATTDVKVKSYMVNRYDVTLKAKSGLITVLANVDSAEVKLDQKRIIGKTPLRDARIEIGKHEIEISAEGYKTQTKPFSLAEGKPPQQIEVTLKNHEDEIRQRISRYRFARLTLWGGALVSATVGGYYYFDAKKNYDKYNDASTSSDAVFYKEKAENSKFKKEKMWLIAGGTALLSSIPWFLQHRAESVLDKHSLFFMPQKDGVTFMLSFNLK